MNNRDTTEKDWDLVISGRGSILAFRLHDLWKYRDLTFLMVKRDVVTTYKQTILGPLWFFIQPLLTTLVFTVVFGMVANLSVGDVPHVVFYLSGIILWNFFSDIVSVTSKTFTDNASIFGKVYFPRLIMPLSKVFSGLIKFVIQFILFVILFGYYQFVGVSLDLNLIVLLIPSLIVLVAVMGMGIGLLLSSLTVKYRDLTYLISFGLQLLMYATPVILPLSKVPMKYQWLMKLNPMTSIIEVFRAGFFGAELLDWSLLVYSLVFTFFIFVVGLLSFNRAEKSFMDIV